MDFFIQKFVAKFRLTFSLILLFNMSKQLIRWIVMYLCCIYLPKVWQISHINIYTITESTSLRIIAPSHTIVIPRSDTTSLLIYVSSFQLFGILNTNTHIRLFFELSIGVLDKKCFSDNLGENGSQNDIVYSIILYRFWNTFFFI